MLRSLQRRVSGRMLADVLPPNGRCASHEIEQQKGGAVESVASRYGSNVAYGSLHSVATDASYAMHTRDGR